MNLTAFFYHLSLIAEFKASRDENASIFLFQFDISQNDLGIPINKYILYTYTNISRVDGMLIK